jgi:hypothetical protein
MVPFLLAVFNAVITCILLVKMNNYRQKLKFQQNINIQEVHHSTIPMEVQQDVINENNEDRPPPYWELFKPT